MLIKLVALIAGFAGMELVAHLAHKYVMHGFLWSLHKSHHQKGNSFFERNDLYFLIFATPGILLLLSGMYQHYDWKFFLGLGITLYGFTYLILHDIVIHQRLRWFTKLNSPYLSAMRRAHKAHHANVHKNAAVNYGLLWVDKKYFKQNNQQQHGS